MGAAAPLRKADIKVLPVRQRGSQSFYSRTKRWIWWVLAALAVTTAALLWRARLNSQIFFETVSIERGPIEAAVTATGNLNPVVNVQVGSQVSGNIKALYADFNTKVKQGQLVALIDPEIFQAEVDQAVAASASARSATVTAQAQLEKARADFAATTASKSNAQAIAAKDQASLVNAQLAWQRADQLFRVGVVAEQDHDSAKATYDAAQAQVSADQSQIAAAEHNIQAAQAQIQVAQTQLSGAQAQQRQAEASLAQARINLAHTRIVAPVSGTVIARHFDVGQTVAASFQSPDIFDIAQDLTKMQVDTNVDESDVGSIQVEQPVAFTVEAYPAQTFHGTVTDIRKAPINAQNVVTYDVVVNVANPDLKLFPGMTANVTIVTARQENVLKTANAALRFRPSDEVSKKYQLASAPPGVQQLYLLKNSKVIALPVQSGITDGKYTIVSAPSLRQGDQAIVRAISRQSAGGGASTPLSSGQRMPRM